MNARKGRVSNITMQNLSRRIGSLIALTEFAVRAGEVGGGGHPVAG